MAVCVTYPVNAGCEFSKEETAYVSYQEKTPGGGAAMKKLKTVDADTLLYQPLDKPSFVVDGLIPTGLTLGL